MQIGNLLFGQIVQPFHQSLQPSCKQLRIHGDAQHPAFPVPLRRLLPFSVERLQGGGALCKSLLHQFRQPLILLSVVIELLINPAKLLLMPIHAFCENSCFCHSYLLHQSIFRSHSFSPSSSP